MINRYKCNTMYSTAYVCLYFVNMVLVFLYACKLLRILLSTKASHIFGSTNLDSWKQATVKFLVYFIFKSLVLCLIK